MKSKWNWRVVLLVGMLVLPLTVFASGCDEQDLDRVMAGVDAVVNYDDTQGIDFEDWFDQEWDQWF